MGSEEDPKNGGAVAGAVFGAVFIYVVRGFTKYTALDLADTLIGFLRILRTAGLPTHAREPTRCYKPVMILRVDLRSKRNVMEMEEDISDIVEVDSVTMKSSPRRQSRLGLRILYSKTQHTALLDQVEGIEL